MDDYVSKSVCQWRTACTWGSVRPRDCKPLVGICQVSDETSPESLFLIAPSFSRYAGFGLSDLESFIAIYHSPQRSKSRFQIGILYYPEGQMEGSVTQVLPFQGFVLFRLSL